MGGGDRSCCIPELIAGLPENLTNGIPCQENRVVFIRGISNLGVIVHLNFPSFPHF